MVIVTPDRSGCTLSTFLIRMLDRRPSQIARRGTWRGRMVVGWAGLRGAVSLAAALALPADFPARDQILFITFVRDLRRRSCCRGSRCRP